MEGNYRLRICAAAIRQEKMPLFWNDDSHRLNSFGETLMLAQGICQVETMNGTASPRMELIAKMKMKPPIGFTRKPHSVKHAL